MPHKNAKVNQFKALIIGGGGTFSTHNALLNANSFTKGLTLPIVIMGVGARWGGSTGISKDEMLSRVRWQYFSSRFMEHRSLLIVFAKRANGGGRRDAGILVAAVSF